MVEMGCRGGAVGGTVATQQKGSGFVSRPGGLSVLGLHVICLVSSLSPKTCMEIDDWRWLIGDAALRMTV